LLVDYCSGLRGKDHGEEACPNVERVPSDLPISPKNARLAGLRLASPAGDDLIILPSLSDEAASTLYPKEWTTHTADLRTVAQPEDVD